MNDNTLVHRPAQPAGELRFSALSLQDIADLLCEHGDFINSTFGRYAPGFGSGNLQDESDFAGELLIQSPQFIVHMIAKASATDAAVIDRLPAGTQLQALATVIDLTLAGCSPREVFRKLAAALKPLKPHLMPTAH